MALLETMQRIFSNMRSQILFKAKKLGSKLKKGKARVFYRFQVYSRYLSRLLSVVKYSVLIFTGIVLVIFYFCGGDLPLTYYRTIQLVFGTSFGTVFFLLMEEKHDSMWIRKELEKKQKKEARKNLLKKQGFFKRFFSRFFF
uniref:Uncharacterized protein n=1 Tax=Analipus japonicus TaxID=31333 RepID=A0A8F0FD34_9PHAE|nr:hypothetical protein [Analipus japonicus]